MDKSKRELICDSIEKSEIKDFSFTGLFHLAQESCGENHIKGRKNFAQAIRLLPVKKIVKNNNIIYRKVYKPKIL